MFFHVDDLISLSLEYLPPAHAHAHALGLKAIRPPPQNPVFPNGRLKQVKAKSEDGTTDKNGEKSDTVKDVLDELLEKVCTQAEEENKVCILKDFINFSPCMLLRFLLFFSKSSIWL